MGRLTTDGQRDILSSWAVLDDIKRKIAARQYEFSKHAVDQAIIRGISVAELEDAVANQSAVIEDYPEDKYGPSCLTLGVTVTEQFFAPEAVEHIHALITGAKAPRRVIQTPVYEYA